MAQVIPDQDPMSLQGEDRVMAQLAKILQAAAAESDAMRCLQVFVVLVCLGSELVYIEYVG